MAQIQIETEDGDQGSAVWDQDEYAEVREVARRYGRRCAIVALIFEYSDSELIEVFDADGASTDEQVFP